MDMCSESSLPVSIPSPARISFSRNDDNDKLPIQELVEQELEQKEDEEEEDDDPAADSRPSDMQQLDDFSFGVDEFSFRDPPSFENEHSSSADELFSHGLIIPLQLQEKFITTTTNKHTNKTQPFASQPSPNDQNPKQGSHNNNKNNIVAISTSSSSASNEISSEQQKQESKSFWRIKRSSSIHCDNYSNKKTSFWSLPLMLRSNSTGSVPSPRQSLKDHNNTKKLNSSSQKQLKSSSSSSSSSSFYMYQLSQKPPLKKNYGNGVLVNPGLLNVPPPYIAKGTANLFGLGSLFSEKKDKKIKK